MGFFGKSFDETVEAAMTELRSEFPAVQGLNAQIEGKIVTLTGVAPSLSVKAAVINAFNAKVEAENTLNKIRIEAPAPEPVPATEPVPAAETPADTPEPPEEVVGDETERLHEVAGGESLSAISKKYYGTANQYMRIFEANRDVLKNPDLIRPGQKLRIPK